jgi:hypothetical protein
MKCTAEIPKMVAVGKVYKYSAKKTVEDWKGYQ